MIEVFKTAAAVQKVCRQAGWKFCFIGGVAVQRWGEPRFTNDVDLTLHTGFGGEEKFITVLLSHFTARVSTAVEFALKNRVLLLQSTAGVGIDISLGGYPLENQIVERASEFLYPPDITLLTCSAEDLIVMKCFADRGRDWADVEGVLVRQTGKLDWKYILSQLEKLTIIKESPEILARLKKLRMERETNP